MIQYDKKTILPYNVIKLEGESMKRFLRFLIVLLIVSLTATNLAQVQRKVLMEYATNASCGPCAAYNPGSWSYLKSHYDNVVAVWYHAWWPGPNDPMFLFNSQQNEDRINYYNVNAVPNYMVDGIYQGNPGDLNNLSNQISSRLSEETPLWMKVDVEITNNQFFVNIYMKAYGDVNFENMKLHAAVVEQMLNYEKPPGSNGETSFPHVFRQFCAESAGENIESMSEGDSLEINYVVDINEEWNTDVLCAVAWVQSDATQEVIQAASDLKYHELTTSASNIETVILGEPNQYSASVFNPQNAELNLSVKFVELDNTQNWNYKFVYAGNETDEFEVTLAPDESIDFDFFVESSVEGGFVNLKVTAENISEESNFISATEYLGAVVEGDYLLIDEDGNQNYEQTYKRNIESLERRLVEFDRNTFNRIKSILPVDSYKAVIYNLGNALPTLESGDINFLMNEYLNSGGNLFIASQNLGYDINEYSNNTTAKFFYRFSLDAKYLADNSASSIIESVPGNPLFDGIEFTINSVYEKSADVIESNLGNSIPVLQFDDGEGYAMLIHQKNDFKAAYLTIGIEQIPTPELQDQIITAVLNWFDEPTSVDGSNQAVPGKFGMAQNYPNPFNPSTSIEYDIASPSNVSIKVFDALGREVSVLVDEFKPAGKYYVYFTPGNLSSGIYYYTIQAGEYYSVKKMIYLK